MNVPRPGTKSEQMARLIYERGPLSFCEVEKLLSFGNGTFHTISRRYNFEKMEDKYDIPKPLRRHYDNLAADNHQGQIVPARSVNVLLSPAMTGYDALMRAACQRDGAELRDICIKSASVSLEPWRGYQ